jgi:hypothetical protein
MSFDTRSRVGLLLGASAVAGAVMFTIGSRSSEPEVEPGTTVLSIWEDGIRSIIYRTGTMTLTARRTDSGPFEVHVTYNHGQTPRQCQASQDLAGLLPDLGEIKARRQLTPQEVADEFPLDAGIVELKDEVDEPIPPLMARLTKDGSAVAVVYGHTAIEADITPDVFAKLGKGCAWLAGAKGVVKRPPQR